MISSALNIANIIASELGLDSWQIQSGSYNGEIFHVVTSLLDTLNNEFNPAAGVLDAAKSAIGAVTGNNTDAISLIKKVSITMGGLRIRKNHIRYQLILLVYLQLLIQLLMLLHPVQL